ncbi:tRNA (guanosine(37)-N1)-methyltransferase TrmD [uncultured Algimonas sp.]|uniref:tRNA (guanosine(37)-N1)-methyltransferase TrmD n=1 Tax=uncultured Algimonas sp. TaxID=1547920 RepID=UPI0026399CEC|nr:tRNA (guanosine(37)-N1)-methyltransferase TrmD [uncultured Algimonas sp.]
MTDAAKITWRATVLSLYPDAFPGVLGTSVIGTAEQNGLWQLETVDIRDFAVNRHRTVDGPPAGGGAGLVLKPDISAKAIDSVVRDDRPLLYMTPRGRPLTQDRVRQLASGPGLVCFCGRFEGLDQRVIESRGMEEVSIGDFVLAGGEVAAQAMIEACVRLLPGVLGNSESALDESFEDGLLEYPLYTRPREFEGRAIPAVLTSGDHGAVDRWRRTQMEEITKARRPDLWDAHLERKGESPLRSEDNERD